VEGLELEQPEQQVVPAAVAERTSFPMFVFLLDTAHLVAEMLDSQLQRNRLVEVAEHWLDMVALE